MEELKILTKFKSQYYFPHRDPIPLSKNNHDNDLHLYILSQKNYNKIPEEQRPALNTFTIFLIINSQEILVE